MNHDTLGKVRSLENRFIPIRAILVSFEEVVDGLKSLGGVLSSRRCVERQEQRRFAMRLENTERYARTFTRTSLFLQQRSNNTATLLADTLAFRNQGVAQEQNSSMVLLTRSAVFITVITLIYLPWTLVSVRLFHFVRWSQQLIARCRAYSAWSSLRWTRRRVAWRLLHSYGSISRPQLVLPLRQSFCIG